jgi:uncharacterized protein
VTFFGQSRETAILATSPGAFSYALAIAATGVGDTGAVVVIQSVRLTLITTCLPPLLGMIGPSHGSGGMAQVEAISLPATATLFCLAVALGLFLHRKRLPAAFLISGVLLSGVAHYFGMVSGRPQAAFLFIGFVVTGSVIGSRFSRIPLVELKRLCAAALAVVLVSSLVAGLSAIVVARMLSIPFGQVWIAFAPGGVEAMAAMALALRYDSAYIAIHHLARIFGLIFFLPIVLKLFGKAENE